MKNRESELCFCYLVAGLALVGTWNDFAVKSTATATSTESHANTFDATDATRKDSSATAKSLTYAGPVTSGLLLGSTIAAMFLGHWYLNTPTMELEPLRKVVGYDGGGGCRGGDRQRDFAGSGVAIAGGWSTSQYPLLALHWLAGIFGTAVLTWMAWQTLKIPNTQSATGILYVAVITTFIGELSSLLLSGSTGYPV